MMWGRKGGISFDVDSGLLCYVLWCCGSICHPLFTFIQICFVHTVANLRICLTIFLFFFFFLKGSWKVSFLTVRFDNFVHFNLNRQFIPCRKSKQRKFCGLKFQNSWKNVMTSLQTLEICQNDCILFLYTQWNWGTFNQL